jgi:hypothetical protein
LPPSLSVRITREFLFSVILRKSEKILGKVLSGKSVSQSSCTLPPGVKKHIEDIEGQFLGAGFSGAYVSNADCPESRVDVGYVQMAIVREQPFAYFSGGRSRNTKLLTASLAIAVAELVGSPIEDSGHHWIKKDEYSPDELLAAMIELASNPALEES